MTFTTRHPNDRSARNRPLPVPHKDFDCAEPWYRSQSAGAVLKDWPLEAQEEVADIGTCPQGRPRVLNPAQIVAIRRRYQAGGITYKELAYEFGVSIGTIGLIVRHQRWARVPEVEQQDAA